MARAGDVGRAAVSDSAPRAADGGDLPASRRLAGWAVFVDFDGTITTLDVGTHLLERFVPGRYEAIDARYEDGTIGSREWFTELWSELGAVEPAELLAAAREVPLDPDFDCLVDFLTSRGARVTVVSDGLGVYVHDLLCGRDVAVRANGVDDDRRPLFAFADDRCPCGRCGTCKVAPVRDARAQGLRTAVVGDGTSDRYAAAAADLVFAKGRLVDWCRLGSVDYVPFEGLVDVLGAFRALAGEVPASP